ncbi:IclR family transcriptional regulator [Pseudoprimorskyibacter insulae]|nr:IclR family transcriptional regulator [Pseudoprimorskyibacter insulae]
MKFDRKVRQIMAPDTRETNQDRSQAPVGTVTRTLRVISLLADLDEQFTVKTVADGLNLAPSTAHRLLNQLASEGFVVSIPRTRSYETGPEFYRIASRILAKATAIHLAEQTMKEIAAKYDETVVFGLHDPNRHALVFIARADGSNALTYRIELNKPLSLVWGASGKAALAYVSDDEVAAALEAEGRSPASNAPPPTLVELAAQLHAVREKGFAISKGEKLAGARGIAAPVFGPGGLVGSICLTSPASQLEASGVDIESIGQDIAQYCAQLSHTLGGNVPGKPG